MDDTPPRDEELLLRYLDGDLPQQEALALELRLSEEPGLADDLQAFARLDALQRAVLELEGVARPLRASRPWAWRLLLGLAAAALLVVVVRQLGTDPPPDAAGETVALQPTAPNLFAYTEALGLTEPRAPEGHALRGAAGADELELLSPAEYVAWIAEPARRGGEEALASSALTGTAETFVIPLRVERPTSAIVVLLQEDGSVVGANGEPERIAFPAQETWTAELGRVPPGTHVLPGEVVRLSTDPDGTQRVQFDPGFLVPRRSGALHVLVALRAEPLDMELRRELERAREQSLGRPARARLDALREALTGAGFRCLEGRVTEP